MLTQIEILQKLPTATKAERRELLKLARELSNDPLARFRNKIIQGDCLEVMKEIPDNSINLILTDPPYHRVKNLDWDRQWKTANDFLNWIDKIAEQWQRILKSNGSLYCFASPKMSARVEVKLAERFNIVNRITWAKPCPFSEINKGASNSGLISKETLRGYYPNTESIIFCEHYGADNIAKGEAGYGAKCDELRGFIFAPIADYLKSERDKAGWQNEDAKIAVGHSPKSGCHWFDRSQWTLPTKIIYETWQMKAPGYFTRSYEELRQQYEELRRPFSVSADVPYTDVWTFPTVSAYKGKHPCEKPSAMLEHIIKASSREGDMVLDCFAGSGSTLFAAKKLNRQSIGIELDQHWVTQINHKLEIN